MIRASVNRRFGLYADSGFREISSILGALPGFPMNADVSFFHQVDRYHFDDGFKKSPDRLRARNFSKVKFPFKIKSRAHLTVRPTEVFERDFLRKQLNSLHSMRTMELE